MTRGLRVGLVGAGDISKFHLAAWRAVDGADVVAVCDIDRSRATARAKEFGVEAVFDDASSMFAAEDLDAVDIATWRTTHPDLIRLAADRALHVLCQKPLADTFDEAAAVTAAVDGRVRLMVNENRRFGPEYRTIRRWIDEGRLGPVHQVFVTGYRSSLIRRPDGTRPAVKRAVHYARESRLVVAGALTHQLDVLRYLLGPLTMLAARTVHTEADLPGETVATLMLETVSGAPVVIGGNSAAPGYGDTPSARNANPSTAADAAAGAATGAALTGDRLELLGTTGSVMLEGNRLRLLGAEPEDIELDPVRGYQACFDGAVRHFVDCLATGLPFETSAEDNLETLRLVEQAYELAAGGAVSADKNVS